MLDGLKDVVRKSSIHVCLINTGGCNGCDIEVVALLSPRYDLEQYGIYVHNNPREADVILVTGAVTEQWKENLQRIYSKAPEPKVVVAIGNCPLPETFSIRRDAVSMPLYLILYPWMRRYLDAHLDLQRY